MIDLERLDRIPQHDKPLVIELAGGLLVPLTGNDLQIDQIKRWNATAILVASTELGTINHSLLSIEALKRRPVNLRGIVFTGGPNPETEAVICRLGRVRHLGRMPPVLPLTRAALSSAFSAGIRIDDFKHWQTPS